MRHTDRHTDGRGQYKTYITHRLRLKRNVESHPAFTPLVAEHRRTLTGTHFRPT